MQQRHAYTIDNRLLTICWLGSIFAKTCLVDPIDRHLMLGDEVANH